MYLNYGKPANYAYALAGPRWNNNTFYPRYNIVSASSGVNGMFRGCSVTDLAARLKECGVTLDTSNATELYIFAAYSEITHFPTVDSRRCDSLSQSFYHATKLVTIDKLILRDSGDQTFNIVFSNCKALQNLVIEGTIGQNGFDTKWSTKLSKESIISIIEHLSITTSGLTVTLSKVAVNKAFETSDGAMDGSTSDEWLALAATKANWTISLIN